MKRALKLAYIYTAASVIIGPTLVLISSSKHASGWDCGDSAWNGSNTTNAMREAIYDHNARFMVTGAYIMLAVGLSILGYLIYVAYTNKQLKKAIIPTLTMIFVFLGYLAIIAIAASPWCGATI